MKISELLDVMRTERECISRQECDRDCGKCDLVMETDIILEAYNEIIEILENLKW